MLQSFFKLAQDAKASAPGPSSSGGWAVLAPNPAPARGATFAKSSLPEFGLSMEMRHLAQSEFWQATVQSLEGHLSGPVEEIDRAMGEAMIGRALWLEGKPQSGRAQHVLHDHDLVAVLDASSLSVFIKTQLPDMAVDQLVVVSRPVSAAGAPAGFRVTDAWSLAWRYGQLIDDAQDLVPAEYATQALAVRRLPAIEVGLVEPRHMLLFRALASGPKTMSQLAHQIGLTAETVKRDIASLYLVRALRVA